MANNTLGFDFLAINKDFFTLGLNPTELLVLSQICEFQRNTNECFISNKKLAEQFNVSESTIKRALDRLELLGFIERETKASQKGKDRKIRANDNKIAGAAKAKMNLADDDNKSAKAKMNLADGSKCPFRKEQNEPIKEKNEEKREKDNIGKIEEPTAHSIFLETNEEPEEPKVEELGSLNNPYKVDRDWLVERYNSLTVLANGFYMYGSKFYKMEDK